MDYNNMNILQLQKELKTPPRKTERIDPNELKREIFFHDYAPLLIDETSQALIYEIFRLIDSAARLEPVSIVSEEDLAITYNSGFISGYMRAYEEIREAAKKKIKEVGSSEN